MAMEEFAFPNRHALATAIAERLADALRDGIKRNGTASLVVPGGTTPVDVFEHLAGADLAWEKINVIPCDERWVAVDHADSNEGLIRRHLMIGKATRAQVCTLYRPLPSPSDTLPDVTRALQTVKRPFDAVFLGMGEDGHFASLFPGRTETASALALDQPQDLMALNTPAKGYPRIGLTLRALRSQVPRSGLCCRTPSPISTRTTCPLPPCFGRTGSRSISCCHPEKIT